MHILITGGAGFLGSHLADSLLAEGHSVLVVDNFLTGRPENIAHLASHPRFSVLRQDICEAFDPGPFDFVYHLASPDRAAEGLEHATETLRAGSVGTIAMLELARKHRAGFLLASSSECYGVPQVWPQPESYWGNADPVGPRSAVAESKRFAEAATMAWHRYHGVDTHIARLFDTYGPRLPFEDSCILSRFVRHAMDREDITILGDGTEQRSFCFISDQVEGLIALARSSEHEPVNLGHPQVHSTVECAQMVLKLTASRSRLVYRSLQGEGKDRQRPDISRAQSLLGWSPRVELEEGLLWTIQAIAEETQSLPTWTSLLATTQ
jgi:dTDP-glucose 4,6-dehydratase